MIVSGSANLGDILGVSQKSITEWTHQGMPVQKRGKTKQGNEYETAQCIRWMIQREMQRGRIERQQDRLARVQADKIEMENEERRGVLITAAKIEPAMRAAVIAASEYLRNSRDDVLRRILDLNGKGSYDALEDRDNGFLERLADWPSSDEYTDEESDT